MAWLGSLDVQAVWHAATIVMLVWLGLFFGRTLAPGKVPLIERIARVSDPGLEPFLVDYTRRLTWVWCAYFLAAAAVAAGLYSTSFPTGPVVALGSVLLFVGEHELRKRLFPDHAFPGLAQQVRDTWSVWRPARAHD